VEACHETKHEANVFKTHAHYVCSEFASILASYQMQSLMAILIAYCIGKKKDHQTLLNFAILAGKRQKSTFSYKVALKNFHGRAKGGGIAPWPSP